MESEMDYQDLFEAATRVGRRTDKVYITGDPSKDAYGVHIGNNIVCVSGLDLICCGTLKDVEAMLRAKLSIEKASRESPESPGESP